MKHLLFVTLLFSTQLLALNVQFRELSNEHYQIEMRLEDADLKFSTVEHNGLLYTKVNFGEGLNQSFIGEPDLPRIHRWIALKSHRPLIAQADFSDLTVFENILVHPVIADTIDDGRSPVFKIKSLKDNSQWYFEHPFAESPIVYVGNIPVQPIMVAPMNYHPASRRLNVYRKITINLYPSPSVELGPLPGQATEFGKRQIKSLALNGKSYYDSSRIAAQKAVIVTTSELKAAALSLQTLWNQAGLQSKVLEIEASSLPTKVQSQLQDSYKKYPVDYVLLLGDQQHIPFYEHALSVLGDVSYSYLVGTDQIADVSLGRIPVKNITEANYVIEKIVKYRKLLQQGHQDKDVVMIAHSEDYPGKYTENSETIRTAENPKNLNYITQYGGETATNASVIAKAIEGAAIINYRGHGSEIDWSFWDKDEASFSFSQIDLLPTDFQRMPFVFNVACSNGAIHNAEGSFVQKLLIPTIHTPYQGAIGTFGATEASYTIVNHQFNIHLFKLLQELDHPTIGEVYTGANNRLVQENGGIPPSNVEMYVLYSDPSLHIWNE